MSCEVLGDKRVVEVLVEHQLCLCLSEKLPSYRVWFYQQLLLARAYSSALEGMLRTLAMKFDRHGTLSLDKSQLSTFATGVRGSLGMTIPT